MDSFAPTTTDYGLLALPLDEAAAALSKLFADAGVHLTRSDVQGHQAEVFARLEPLSMAMDRRLLVAKGPDWTSYFANGLLGSDVFLPVSRIAAATGCTGLRVVRSPEATIFEAYESPERGGDQLNSRRSIYAAQDGKWTFGSHGTPYPFEDVSRYEARRIRDRFTPAMLDDLLDSLGAPRAPIPDGSDLTGILFTQANHAPNLPRWSYAEVQAGVPWKRDRDAL